VTYLGTLAPGIGICPGTWTEAFTNGTICSGVCCFGVSDLARFDSAGRPTAKPNATAPPANAPVLRNLRLVYVFGSFSLSVDNIVVSPALKSLKLLY
jgi:hypothetical protein